MDHLEKLEKEVLNLPFKERELLALAVWESLEKYPMLDAEAIEVALRRDAEIESGSVKMISHSEFMQRTNSGK